MFEVVVLAVEAEHILGPQASHQLDLLLLPLAPGAELLIEGVVLDRVPADADTEHEPVARQNCELGRLLGDEHRLALREDQDRRDQIDAGGARREEPEQHHRLVEGDVRVVRALEPAGSVTVDADDVVVDQQVGDAELFGALGVRLDGTRVVPDLVVGDDSADLHVAGLSGRRPVDPVG